MHFLLLFLILLLSFSFLFMNHPLSMGFILMIQTLMISLMTGSLSISFWFSYSLFLIFLGGMLILFMYMTSLASNEIFKINFNKKIMIILMNLMMIMFFINLFLDLKNLNLIKNFENYSLMNMKNFLTINQNNYLLNKMFNFPTNMISILLINYLFLTLIMSVKITNIFKGPLRLNLI